MLLDDEPAALVDDLYQARELARLICASDEAINGFIALRPAQRSAGRKPLQPRSSTQCAGLLLRVLAHRLLVLQLKNA
ncbi:hypothetical protein [Bradyrhizobium sp. C9]|uniref:hypothetical protein n=1 Tax=Bradyrhizobium sp. C9 TaxID=142585 RepID=UPI00117835B6|nr:hypothetical protein [Bradyrhizobium sp. C9]